MPTLLPLPDHSRIGILTSGGDSPGMNAAVRTAVKMIRARGHLAVGVLAGYRGLIDGRARELETADVEGIERRGGTFLGSARALDFHHEEGQQKAAASVRALKLDALIVVGGNGSLTGARIASRFDTARGEKLRVIGLPASIDNDIGHTTSAIGVDTALNTIVEACDKISDTASSHNRAFIVEVMGRDCGYLAMAAAIATGADGVLFRESGKSDDALVTQIVHIIESAFSRTPPKPRVLILKSEGVKVSIDALKSRTDEELKKRGLAVEVRNTVLGHVVRGGAPSAHDRLMSGRLGRAAVFAAIEGHTDVMIAWQSRAPRDGIGTVSPHDPYCSVIPLEAVLTETAHLLDGTSPVVKWRAQALSEVEELLHF